MLYHFSVFPSTHFVDLGMYQCGHEQCEPGHSFGPASRNHWLFHYVLSGCGTLLMSRPDGTMDRFSVKTGEGFLLIPDHVTTYVADERIPWEYVWIEFDGLRVKQALDLAGFSPEKPVYHSHAAELRDVLSKEMLYIAEHPDETPLHLIGHLYLFFDALIRSSAGSQITTGSKLRDFYVKEAISFIEGNFQNDISVEDIAKNSGLNRSYFGKIFKESVGQSPQNFLLTYRMIKAAELLKLTDLSVADVGCAVGYLNQLHFSRAFKGVYGLSPRAWRNQNRVRR